MKNVYNMENVYIGKASIKNNGIAICKVLYSDIATGNSIVYNRETNKIEILLYSEKLSLQTNIKKLAEDTENEYTEKIEKALAKMNN